MEARLVNSGILPGYVECINTRRVSSQLKSCNLCKQRRFINNRHQLRNAVNGISTTFWRGDQSTKNDKKNDVQEELEEAFKVNEHTVDTNMPKGTLSPAAINAIEQFSRLNGITGKRMRENFERLAPVSLQNDAQSLLEFCCFRYLARGSPDFNPILKDEAFRRLTFITMLGWQQPYVEETGENHKNNLHVYEPAFVRFAPAIPGAADIATAHHLYKALTADRDGLPFHIWNKYLSELCSVLNGREDFRRDCTVKLEADECPICFGASPRQPVQKWDKGIAWPGNLTMTDRALYFEAFRIPLQSSKTLRLPLDASNVIVERTKVGPFGVELFDSAIFISTPDSESWILEFVDFSGKGRREIWYLYIREIIATYNFIREYAPEAYDSSYNSKSGKRRAINTTLFGIARFQALQATLGKPPDNPERFFQFSYLADAPCGFLVFQTMAVDFWGGRMELNTQDEQNTNETSGYIVGTDGGIYLRKWMVSETWKATESVAFWKHSGVKGLVLGKNHVVGGQSQIERAVKQSKEQSREVERTKATIEGAIIAGIPENIDLLKELFSPLQRIAIEVKRLRDWEEPPKTIAFLLCFYGALYKKWLWYFTPAMLFLSTVGVLALRSLKASGRVEPDFGKVTIKEQPPSNTIQKIISLKEALAELETQLQKINVALLKIRTLALSSNPKATNVAVACFIVAAVVLTTVPFRIVLGMLVLEQFTVEMEWRKPMVREFFRGLKGWWESIPAIPVIVEPRGEENASHSMLPENPVVKSDALIDTLNQWFGDGKPQQNPTNPHS